MERSQSTIRKVDRVRTALANKEPDRIPVHEFFWTSFLRRWRQELGLPGDASPYTHYDLDLMVVIPNLDPHIRQMETIKGDENERVVRTGFGALVRKVYAFPMPEYAGFETDTISKVKDFHFDDPADDRRFTAAIDDHVNCVGDDRVEHIGSSFMERVKSAFADFAVFGTVIEASEFMVRSIGQANMLLWIGMYPEVIGEFARRINAFMVDLQEAQIKSAGGLLDGLYLAGDVAYVNGMLFAPDYWRQYFKPGLKAMCDVAHRHGLPVFYHGCGNVSEILEDFIEVGIDGVHPLEAKAGLDLLEIRKRVGHRLAFFGNMDVRLWGRGDRKEIEASTLRKLNAAKGGGYIFSSDHSVPSSVSGGTYDYLVRLVREHGAYPIRLGEFDLSDFS
jgi:uroporphyrinogen decarboxylase